MNKKVLYEEFNKIKETYHNKNLYFTLKLTEYNDYSGNIKITVYTPWDNTGEKVVVEHHFYSKKERDEKFEMVLVSFRCFLKDYEKEYLYKAMEYNYNQEILIKNEYHLNIGNMLLSGRVVHIIPITNKEIKCADCYGEATRLIIENDGHTWFYCGRCSIGG